MTLNIAPEISFKFDIECTSKTPVVEIPNISIKDNALIKVKGLTPDYLKICGDKLYWSIQNTNKAEDLNQITLDTLDQQTYLVNLKNIPSVIDKKAKFPISFLLKLHIKNRSDEKEIKTLGTGVLTVTNFNPNKTSTVKLTENPTESDKTTTSDSSVTSKPKIKVKK